MMQDREDSSVEDINDFSYKTEGGSLKDIVLRHIRKLSDISCQELTASYTETTPQKIGDDIHMVEKYHPSLIEAFINGVDFLLTLTTHCISQDTTGNFKDILQKLEEKEDEEWKKAQSESWEKEDWILTKLNYRKKLLREIMLMLDRIQYFAGTDGGMNE